MNQYLSDKIKMLSFVSIIFVLYIHSGFNAQDVQGMVFVNYIVDVVSGKLGRCAVPLFFAISGYLFFYSIPNGLYSVFIKMKKRVKTLLIPYIISSVFFIVFYLCLEIVPGVKSFMNNSLLYLFNENFLDIIKYIFIDSGTGMPLAFQLWFLKDLIIMIAFAPFWYVLLKNIKIYWVLIAILLGYIYTKNHYLFSLFWFLGGTQLKKLEVPSKYHIYVLYIAVCIIEILFPEFSIWTILYIPIILLGVVSILSFYNILVPEHFLLNNHLLLKKICSFTFFIYLFHEPSLNIIKKAFIFILGKHEIGYIITYLFSPWIFLLIAIVIGIGLKKYFPQFYSITTGGR
jgi:surface polysaccharide O-acyltransferase-like enzyme